MKAIGAAWFLALFFAAGMFFEKGMHECPPQIKSETCEIDKKRVIEIFELGVYSCGIGEINNGYKTPGTDDLLRWSWDALAEITNQPTPTPSNRNL